jgi:flagellar biosynthesis GTPase FlhF
MPPLSLQPLFFAIFRRSRDMPKNIDTTEPVIPQKGEKIDKVLYFTKDIYTNMVQESFAAIKRSRRSEKDPVIIAGLYGIYYNAFAGLIRSGVLCNRAMGIDGFPEIHIMIDNQIYKVRESILLALFGTEAEAVIKPWQDTSASYIDHPFAQFQNQNDESVDNKAAVRSTEAKYKAAMAAMKSANDKALKELQQKDAEILSTKLSQQKSKYEQVVTQLMKKQAAMEEKAAVVPDENAIKALKQQHSMELSQMKQQYEGQIRSMQGAMGNLQKTYADQKAEYDKYRTAAEKEISEHKKYVYDPNYDHYYSDVLPKLVDSLEFTHTDLVIRGFCVALSLAGIVLSLTFFI